LSEQAVAAAIDKVVHREDASPDASRDGLCIDCGREIGAERLAALSSAVRCIRCQGTWEQANRY
jgi:RNA polymerase-binding transcription factor DksA